MENQPLHIKYRPDDFDQVVGQKEVIQSLTKVLESNNVPHTFLFTGPSGTGKTTLARILARRLGCTKTNLLEIDAATHSGIDAMRALLENIRFQGFGGTVRFIIIDECHALSKATWQSLLLALEDPPAHVYWALCTTEPDKVPKAILTRCHAYKLNRVHENDLWGVVEAVVDLEKLEVNEEIAGLAVREAGGSVRQLLVYLSMVNGIESKEEALRLLQKVEESGPAIELARLLVSGQGATWDNCIKLLDGLRDEGPESLRLMIVNYVNKVLLGANSKGKYCGEKEAARLLSILDAFSRPCNASEGMAPILLAVGSLVLQ